MTERPRPTASLIAPVTLPASEHEITIASAPSFTACAMRWAWTWPSSWGGVSHATSISTPLLGPSSFAAASAPDRAARNTGLVELLAMSAILIFLFPPAAPAAAGLASPEEGAGDGGAPEQAARMAARAARAQGAARRGSVLRVPPVGWPPGPPPPPGRVPAPGRR